MSPLQTAAQLALVVAVTTACSSSKKEGEREPAATTPPLALRLVYEADLFEMPEAKTLEQITEVLSKRLTQIPDLKGAGVVRIENKTIVVELPGLESAVMRRTQDIIGRTGQFRIHAVDTGSAIMQKFCSGRNDAPLAAGIEAKVDRWTHFETKTAHSDCYLLARDRSVFLPVADARLKGCGATEPEIEGEVRCDIRGSQALSDFEASGVVLPDDRRLMFERVVGSDGGSAWRTYYVHRTASIGKGDIASAKVAASPGRPSFEVIIKFTDKAARRFAELTKRSVGSKLAIVIDGVLESAPIVQTAITAGSVSITFGSGDPEAVRGMAGELVSVLNGGELPTAIALSSINEIK